MTCYKDGGDISPLSESFHDTTGGSFKNPESDFTLKEQECIAFVKRCKSLRDMKVVHCQIVKLGLIWSSFCASNLVATCALSDWGSMDYACSIFRQIDDPDGSKDNCFLECSSFSSCKLGHVV
nr:pentatricopeptide repeat-containing protein At1g31920-like isoform X3 [Coffea arabica]